MDALHVATLNIRNSADRWAERLGLLLPDMAALQPDLMGDFTAEPVEPAYLRMTEAGYASAHQLANGREPGVTWPSGLQAAMIDTDGTPGCLDYIWVSGAVRVESCRVVFDRPHPDDPGLYPSDHFGLSAHLVA